MILRSRAVSPKGCPRPSSPISIATAGSSLPPRRRAETPRALIALALLALAAPACAYLNTFYNARQAYDEGVRLSAGSDSLPRAAREAFRTAVEKSATVLERYPDSDYVDDALFLMAESLYRVGDWGDAAATYERYVRRFPEGERVGAARLGWARSERRAGDYAAAQASLAPLLEVGAADASESEVLYEHAMILLGTGQRDRALATYRRLLDEHPGFARDRELTLEFAEAELAAGEYDSALAAYRALSEAVDEPLARREIEMRSARALALEGRDSEALAAYGRVLETAPADSIAARIEVERGALLESSGEWDAAEAAYLRVAQLAPGSPAASRATLHRGRIVWRHRGDRERALDVLLDAFIHAPSSVWGDSARRESREVARLLHFERIAAGQVPVPQIEEPDLARSTSMYRLAEEVLEAERDPRAAAEIFQQIVERFPSSPWAPWAQLASGKLLSEADETAGHGVGQLLTLVEEHPDHPASDSARELLGLPVPERPGDFYVVDPDLTVLARVLPAARDPMLDIEDQMNRYRTRDAAGVARTTSGVREPPVGSGVQQEPDEAAPADAPPPAVITTPTGRVLEP